MHVRIDHHACGYLRATISAIPEIAVLSQIQYGDLNLESKNISQHDTVTCEDITAVFAYCRSSARETDYKQKVL